VLFRSSTLNQIYQFGKNNNLCLEDSIIKLLEKGEFKPKIKTALTQLINMITIWRKDSLKMKHFDLLKLVLDESGYSSMLKDKKDLENENRLENLKELLRAMQDYDSLQNFLEHVALATSIDQEWEGAKVNLMTMHAAKGLEFDVVFLPGWEEGLFPHQKSLEEKGDFALEEERRLAYVGITRAKKEAYLSFAMKRAYHGDWMDALPSRFINEIPEDSVEKNDINIGLSWSGNPNFPLDEYRSISFKNFKEILNIKKINFFKLSQNVRNEEFLDYHSFSNLFDFGDKSLFEISEVMKELDLVISSDTSIIHLAGILNIKSILLLNYNSDWRWFED
jgi:DNA helicase-2/ATP-dependent DNA helicase PcrA